jgi:hypothetical protein
METKFIKIAPNMEEITITERAITTEWSDGITYECSEADMSYLRQTYTEWALKKAFQTAIALASKPWNIKQMLNTYFRVDGWVK